MSYFSCKYHTHVAYYKYLSHTPSVLLLLVLAPSSTDQNTGSGRRQGGVPCIDCGDVTSAICTTDYIKQTITCTVDTTSCDYRLCDEGDGCFLVFTHVTISNWRFSTVCFRPLPVDWQNECVPEGSDRASASFPPPVGFHCQCNEIEKCSLDEPFVYVHPSQSSGSLTQDALPLPTLLPSSSSSSSSSSTSHSGD